MSDADDRTIAPITPKIKVPQDLLPTRPPGAAPAACSPRWATMAEAAAYIGGGIHPRTVREWIAEGRIPGYKLGPRFVRVDLNDLDSMARRIPAGESWGDVR